MNCKEFLNISGFIKNFSLASFCCKTAIYMQYPVQKSRTDYFFHICQMCFPFSWYLFFFFFFSETFSHLILLFIKPLWRAWEVTLETSREHAFPTRLNSSIFSLCMKLTANVDSIPLSQNTRNAALAAGSTAPIPVVPEQAFSATHDIRRHCSDR